MNLTELEMAEKRISSLEIASLANKLHKDVMKAIRVMEPAWEKTTGRKFALSGYKDSTGRTLPCYSLNKVECLFIATKFNDEARAKIILRWEELEKSVGMMANLSKTQFMAQAVLLANEEIQLLRDTIESQKDKVFFANAVEASEGCIYVAQLANLLHQNGYETGQKRLFQKLRELGYLYKRGRDNRPKQKYIEKGYFEVKVDLYTDEYGDEHETLTPMVTPKGQKYFLELFCSKNEEPASVPTVFSSSIMIINNA